MKANAFSILCVFCIGICLITAGCCSSTSTTVKPAEQTVTSQQTSQSVATPDQTAPPTQTTKSTPTPEQIVTASMSESLVVETYSGTFEITVLNYLRGSTANAKIKQANMFNEEPDSDSEYLLVNIKEKYLEGKSSQYVSPYEFKAYVDGVGYSPAMVVMPDDLKEFESVSILQGGQISGYIPYMVPKGRPVKIAYEYLMEPQGFIALS